MRLGLTRAASRRLIAVGAAFGGVMAPTAEALETGRLDWRKAATIITTLDSQPGPVAWAVQDELLPRAIFRTHPQVVRDLNKALVAVDPHHADQRQRRASARRHVQRLSPLPDGQAAMRLVGPAQDLVALDLAAEAGARAAKGAGDPRTTDQLRFDTLTTLAQHALVTGWAGTPPDAGGTAGTTGGSAPPTPTEPAPFPGWPGPAMRLSPAHIQVRLTVPLSVALPPEDTTTHPDPGGVSPPAALPTEVVPACDLAAAEVAELDGYGPLTPDVARALAAGGTWRRIVTDPLSGAVLDVGRTTYRPPTDLVRHLAARDRSCVSPTCQVPPASCQIDHTVPWSQGGPTADWNSELLCTREHLLKSSGAFGLDQPTPGTFVWTTPTGHRYQLDPDGTVTPLDPPDDLPPF